MDADQGRQTTAIRLQRLAVPVARGQVPSFAEVGLGALVDEATEWQLLRGSSWFWGWAALVNMPMERWLEIGDLFGSVGESVCLAATAEIEIEILRRAIARGSAPGHYGISQRFLAEAQGTAILGVGHRLANIVARILMSDGSYPWAVADLGTLGRRFPPKAKKQDHWVALSRADDLHRIAVASPFVAVRRMTTAIVRLRKARTWKSLEGQRAVDFHRWREESPFVSKTVYKEAAGKRTLSILGSPDPADPVGRAFIESACLASRAALDSLLPSLTEIRQAWLLAMEELSGGAFRWEDGIPHIRPTTK